MGRVIASCLVIQLSDYYVERNVLIICKITSWNNFDISIYKYTVDVEIVIINYQNRIS